jgi:hypothetical protein
MKPALLLSIPRELEPPKYIHGLTAKVPHATRESDRDRWQKWLAVEPSLFAYFASKALQRPPIEQNPSMGGLSHGDRVKKVNGQSIGDDEVSGSFAGTG